VCFSATLNFVANLVKDYMRSPCASHSVPPVKPATICSSSVEVSGDRKQELSGSNLLGKKHGRCLIFARPKRGRQSWPAISLAKDRAP